MTYHNDNVQRTLDNSECFLRRQKLYNSQLIRAWLSESRKYLSKISKVLPRFNNSLFLFPLPFSTVTTPLFAFRHVGTLITMN